MQILKDLSDSSDIVTTEPFNRHFMTLASATVSSIRGKVMKKDGMFLYSTLHPAATFYGSGAKDVFVNDLKKLADIVKKDPARFLV